MASKFYYNLSNSVGEDAAKIASDSSVYATPKDTFTIHNYYSDADTNANTKANYEYITPIIGISDYGGWASYTYHAIAKDKFYYYNHNTSSSDAYESFKFVNRLSAPLLRKRPRIADWGRCQAPFEYRAMGADSTGYKAKIY